MKRRPCLSQSMRVAAAWFSILIFAAILGPVHPAFSQAPVPTRAIVWSDVDGNDGEVFLTYLRGGDWYGPVQLTHNQIADHTPSVCIGQNGEIYVVWAQVMGNQSRLKWLRYREGESFVIANIDTGMSLNTSPSLAVTQTKAVLLVFAGFDGQDDDIFSFQLNNGNWENRQRLSSDDALPDTRPLAQLNAKGRVRVVWNGFSADGNYLGLESFYESGNWSPEAVVGNKALLDKLKRDIIDQYPDVPGFVNKATASFF